MIVGLTYDDGSYTTEGCHLKEVKLRSSNGTTFSVKEENGNLVITNK